MPPPRPLPTSLPASTLALLDGLPGEWLVLDAAFQSVRASRHVSEYGLLRNGRLYLPLLRGAVEATARDHRVRTVELEVGGAEYGAPPRSVRARVLCLDEDFTAVLIEDVSGAARLDAMRRDFIVNVSHELKTPIGALVLLADAVRSAVDDPVALERFAERMQVEAQRLSSLVSDLTDLSRLQAGEVSDAAGVIAVERVVAEAMDTMRLVAQNKRIDLLSQVPDGQLMFGDEQQILTALRNLVANAVAYSPSFTKVTIETSEHDGFTVIAVQDEGIGIEPADQERIFERFYRVDPARSRETGGTGLGLAIVKHICVSHGGGVEVESVGGQGSTFTMRFPLNEVMVRAQKERERL